MAIRKVLLYYPGNTNEYQPIIRGIYRYFRGDPSWEISLISDQLTHCLTIWRPNGLIGHLMDRSLSREIGGVSIPVINTAAWPTTEMFSQVCVDEHQVGHIAAEHLIDEGYTDLRFVLNDELEAESPTWLGFDQAAQRRLTVARQLQSPWERKDSLSIEPLSDRTRSWFESFSKNTALFVRNDALAIQIIESAKSIGISIPSELAVLSSGNNEFLCDLTDPTLSSIQIPIESVGVHAAEVLANLLNQEAIIRRTVTIAPTSIAIRRSTTRTTSNDPVFDAAMSFIRQNFFMGITIKDVVRAIGVSRSTLERRFREHLGVVPTHEIVRLRIQRACELLALEEHSFRDVAEKCGFADVRMLNHAMQKHLGMHAQEFRSQHLGKPGFRFPLPENE